MARRDLLKENNYFISMRRSSERPSTLMEAMMRSTNSVVEESIEELQPLREAVADCIEQLSEQDRYIVDAINSEFLSYSQLGTRLGCSKPHAWRLKNMAYDKLKVLLLQHPLIQRKLGNDED